MAAKRKFKKKKIESGDGLFIDSFGFVKKKKPKFGLTWEFED